MVVHSKINADQGVDELTTAGTNVIRGAGRLRETAFPTTPEEYGLNPARLDDLRGGEASDNLAILYDLADGSSTGPLLDTLCLNAGAALHICGRADSITDGIDTARSAIAAGTLNDWLKRFTSFNQS